MGSTSRKQAYRHRFATSSPIATVVGGRSRPISIDHRTVGKIQDLAYRRNWCNSRAGMGGRERSGALSHLCVEGTVNRSPPVLTLGVGFPTPDVAVVTGPGRLSAIHCARRKIRLDNGADL